MGVLHGHLCRNDAESFEDALDVRVDGEDVLPKCEKEDAPGGLETDAVEPEEFLFGKIGGKATEVFEFEIPVRGDREEYSLNAAALGPG